MASRHARLITTGEKLLRSGLRQDALKLSAVEATAIQSHHRGNLLQEPWSHTGRDLASCDAAGRGEWPAASSASDGRPAGENVWGARWPGSLFVRGCKEQSGSPALSQPESQLIEWGKDLGRLADLSSRSLMPQRFHRPGSSPMATVSVGLQAAPFPGESQLRLREALRGVSHEGCLHRRITSLHPGGSPGIAQPVTVTSNPLPPHSSSAPGAHLSHTPHRGLSSAPWDFSGASGWGSFGGSPEPQSHKENKVLGYTPEQLFGVVADVARYQEFVPWCVRSEVLWTRGDVMEAELEIGFQLLKERYTSRVTMNKPHSVVSTVGNSLLFDFLNCHWEFRPGPVPQSCHLYFSVEFQFKSALYRQVSDLFFNEVVCCLVSSFEQRCAAIHGPARRLENLQRA